MSAPFNHKRLGWLGTLSRTAGTAAFTVAVISSASITASAQYCPSYTASSTNNNNNCGVEAVPGTDPTDAEWLPIFDLVSRGPAAWGDAGPAVGDIGQGCNLPEPLTQVPARFPCELLMAIAEVESNWTQFCVPTLPADQVGGAERTIISFDCGYGIGQVTSGMHVGEMPEFDRQRVASDPTYNLATGTLILAAKWRNTQCVGDNQPTIIEDWYTATWAYNGLAYVNNPNNPSYDPNRGVYNPQVGGSVPYQEKVFGRMEYTSGRFVGTPLAYPNPGEIGNSGSPPQLSEPSCASPTDCTNTREVHVTSCNDNGSGGAGGQGGQGQGGNGGAEEVGGSSAGVGPSGGPASTSSGATPGGLPGENADCDCAVEQTQRPGWRALSLWLLLGIAAFRRRKQEREG